MRRLLATAMVLCAATAALGQPAPVAQQRPHPAIVRVIAPQRDGASHGSGTLVAVNDSHGLVVTNWHVVRDARGPVVVVFPDGFRSGATVLATDRDWDLAALAIWRPTVEPIALASGAPRRGESLTIAGYGPGWYRTATGRCTQYVSPGTSFPYEMVEVSTPARNGDSGGPILNQRGELAGVLFGSGSGRTTGSYCGRVQRFLASVADDFQRLPANPALIARQPIQEEPNVIAARPEPAQLVATPVEPSAAVASQPYQQPKPWRAADAQESVSPAAPVADLPAPESTAVCYPLSSPTRADQIKTILAAIGLLALLFHGLRLLAMVGRA